MSTLALDALLAPVPQSEPEWGDQQAQVLDEVAAWLDSPWSGHNIRQTHRKRSGNNDNTAPWSSLGDQVRYLAGYAGTGKTTLAKYLGMRIGAKFAAYTGKAAHVMAQKGCPGPTTIHGLIYQAVDSEAMACTACRAIVRAGQSTHNTPANLGGGPCRNTDRERPEMAFQLRPEALLPEDVVMVDECSMVDQQIGADLLSYGCRVLVMGDPAQLPPVGGGGFFTNHEPDWMLTEVHRQAKESGILRLATEIRETGRYRRNVDYGDDVAIIGMDDDHLDEVLAYVNQTIVGKNDTRHVFNQTYRTIAAQGAEDLSPYPLDGDKVVCLRNDRNAGLLNGTLWTVVGDHDQLSADAIGFHIRDEDMPNGAVQYVVTHAQHFDGREKSLKSMEWRELRKRQEFDYGYALTCHKAQGSGWNAVAVVDESRVFREDAARWIYTAATRAARELVIIKP